MVYLAKDSDFTKTWGCWVYTGSEKEVEIPEYIYGELVTSTPNMFNRGYGATEVNKVVLKHSNVTGMGSMFASYSSSQPLDLSKLNTTNVTNMSSMFGDYSSDQPLDLSGLDTTNVTNMSGMFKGYSSDQPLDLSGLDTTNVTNMRSMFDSANSLKEVYARTKEDAEKLKAQATKDGISPKFYIVEKVDLDFKVALGNNKIENVYFKDKKGKLKELKIYRENITELQ